MKKIIILLLLFASHFVHAQTAMNEYQYWFDNDFANAQNGPLSSNLFASNISTNSLSFGEHIFHYRAKDSNNKWSVITSQKFIKPSLINEFEYWIDENYANKITVNNITANQLNVNEIFNATSLSFGFHTLHFRSKNQEGVWSAALSQTFYKASNMQAYEYWFDNDYASKVHVVTSNTEFIHINTLANMASMTTGEHVIHIRSKNEAGKWSGVVSQDVLKNSKIDAYEYWFDNDYNNKVSQTFASPVSSLDINEVIPTNTLTETHHTIHYRIHIQDGTWSTTLSQSFHKQNHIVAYEYWFNDNYSFKITQNITPTEIYTLTPLLDVSSTALGSNTLFIHFKDENGKWSPVITEGFCHNTGDSSIHLKLFLQGYYAGGGTMSSVLMNQGIGNNVLITDSIDVQLRNANSPHQIVANAKVELNTDGTAKIDFPSNIIGSYYLSVKHRNTIETWSSYPIYKGNCPLQFDFSSSSSQAFGDNLIEIEPNIWAFYSGDLNQDENIDLLDVSNLENDINDFQFGYFASDINGDGNVDLLDAPLLESNVNSFIFSVHP